MAILVNLPLIRSHSKVTEGKQVAEVVGSNSSEDFHVAKEDVQNGPITCHAGLLTK